MLSVSTLLDRPWVVADSKLVALKVDVEVDVVVGHVNAIKGFLTEAMAEVKLMVDLEVDAILCGEDGAILGVTVIAGLCVQLLTVGAINLFPRALADFS